MNHQIQLHVYGQILSATVKELLKSDSICESYAQMKKGPVFWTHIVVLKCSETQHTVLLQL